MRGQGRTGQEDVMGQKADEMISRRTRTKSNTMSTIIVVSPRTAKITSPCVFVGEIPPTGRDVPQNLLTGQS